MIDGLAFDLFRRHVRNGADNRAFDGQAQARGVLLEAGRFDKACQPEVENLHAAVRAHHDVGGLEVAVHHVLPVRRRQRVKQRQRDLEELRPRHAALRDHVVQSPPGDQLHRQEVDAVGLLGRIQGDDVGVGEGGNRPGLAGEPIEQRGIGGRSRGRIFSATSRPSRESCARYTSPIPPAPSAPVIS